MRDDLHKKAPIPRKAQAVMKFAGREADRQQPERMRAAAKAALEDAALRDLSAATRRLLASQTNQTELFGAETYAKQACSPLEADVLNQLGMATAPKSQQALETALRSLSESYVREARATMVAEGATRDVSKVSSAMDNAFRAAIPEVAASICRGERTSTQIPAATLSDNLLAPPPSAGPTSP